MASLEQKTPFPLVSGTSLNRYANEFEQELLVNATVIRAQGPTARSEAMLVPRLGKDAVLDIAGADGCFYSNSLGLILLVAGGKLYAVTPKTMELKELHTFAAVDTREVLFEENYTSAVVWAYGEFLAVDPGPTVRTISPTNLGSGQFSSLTFSDGYILASIAGTNQFIRSELTGSYFSDAINFSNLQSNDDITSISMLNREIWMFAQRHTEVWYNAGVNPDQPFVRQDGRVYPVGVRSLNTVHLNGALYNAGSTDDNLAGLYRWTSAGPEKLSFDALDAKITAANTIRILGTLENNHTVITVDLNYGEEYWSYDVESKVWYKREGWECEDVYSIDGQFYGIDSTGIFSFSGSKDRGVDVTCSKTVGVIHALEQRLFFRTLELDIGGREHGTVRLAFSDDSGNTWKNHSFASASKAGNYSRIRFQRLGSARSRVFRITFVDTIIFAGFLDAEVGSK